MNEESNDTWGGLAQGMVEMAPYNAAIPASVVAQAEAAVTATASGSVHPFDGPIADQSGKEVIPAGERLADDKLLGMDWYVEGKLPK